MIPHLCRFDSAEHLVGKKRTYAAVKEAVLSAGRYSIFEATDSPRNAGLFNDLDRDPELERFRLPYPWIGIKRKE